MVKKQTPEGEVVARELESRASDLSAAVSALLGSTKIRPDLSRLLEESQRAYHRTREEFRKVYPRLYPDRGRVL